METQDHYTRQSFDEHRNIACLEKLISDLLTKADELEQEIALEETRLGVFDPQHFAYPAYAKAAMLRRDNLRRSVEYCPSEGNHLRDLGGEKRFKVRLQQRIAPSDWTDQYFNVC